MQTPSIPKFVNRAFRGRERVASRSNLCSPAFHGRASLAILVGLLAAAIIPSVTAQAKTTPKPTLKVSPKTLTINRKATFEGFHLWPSSDVTVVLGVPDLVPKAAEAFVGGIQRVDGHGHLKFTAKVPVLTRCGKATVYVSPFPARKATVVRTHVTLKGCTAGGKGVPPPPPPGGKKKR